MWKLFDPTELIKYGGLFLLLFIVFAETGLLIGFFLPGDSLIFISGLLCATKPHFPMHTPILYLILYMSLAAILGNIAGYLFGRRVGPALFKREDAWLFKKRYVTITRDFYARHGGKTLVLGRFLPIIRTFAPILAGVIRIGFKRFMVYNILGAVLWISGLTLIGYFLGSRFPWIQDYLGLIVVGLIIITAIPVIRTW
ncbi:MAG TPA: VTT domain-containing protein, partial [Bacteroidia bacterium]|nr:VTT domain-containing protein [Bacteroidia bacterium]